MPKQVVPTIVRSVAVILVLLILLSVYSLAQTAQGRISGVILDPQGSAVPGAEVNAVNQETGLRTRAATNAAGLYAFPFLAPGQYVVEVTAAGFKAYRRERVAVQTTEELNLPIQLELGQTTESITVSDEAPVVQDTSATIGQFVDNRVVSQMPLLTLRSLDLVRLSANVVYVNAGEGLRKPYFSVAGGRVWNQSFSMDGANNQNMRLGVGQVEADPPMEAVREFKVLENNYSAEYGGSSGGVIVSTTKSGTNEFHGALYEYLRNDKLNAANFFARTDGTRKIKAPLKVNQFGAALGGPVIKNRTHFFATYEGTRRVDGQSLNLGVPTAEQRRGDFSKTTDNSGRLIPIYDPLSTRSEGGRTVRDQFAGNVVPASRLDPVANKFVKYWPEPNAAAVNLSGAQNFRADRSQRPNNDFVLARLDHSFSDRNRLYFRYINHWYSQDFTSVYPFPESDTTQRGEFFEKSYLLSDTHTITNSLIADFRYSFMDRKTHNIPLGLESNVAQEAGLKGLPAGGFPILSPAGFIGMGVGERRQFPIRQHFMGNSWTWVTGRHLLRFGGELRQSRNIEVNRAQGWGQFNFSPTGTGLPGVAASGNGWASMLVGFVNSYNISETERLNRYNWYLAGYLQDDWKVSPNLTLNLGVRWETDTPITDSDCRMNGFDPLAINPVSRTPGVVRFACQDGWPKSPYSTDLNNFGPRFGFAWRPGGKQWVVRGGYGVFFEHPFATGVPTANALGFQVSANLNSPDNGVTPAFYLRDGVPVSGKPPERNASFGAVEVGRAANTNVGFYEPDRPTGYAQQFNVGVQRRLGSTWVMEIAYLANLGRKLPVGDITLNQVPVNQMGPGNAQLRRPYPQFNNVSIVRPMIGVSNYHSGIARLEKRLSSGLSMQGSYSWSRSIGTVDDFLGAQLGDNQLYQNAYNRSLDKGPNAIDIVHRFTFSGVYDLPFGTGRSYLKQGPLAHILGGWSLSSIVNLQTGGPFTVVTQADTTNAFSAGAQRADVLRDGNLPASERSINRWFDTGAFAAPAAYTFGNAGRGILRADGRANVNLSVIKNFAWGERYSLQFRAQSFNAFNHPDFLPPGRALGAPNFGVIGSATDPRSIQFGLRLGF